MPVTSTVSVDTEPPTFPPGSINNPASSCSDVPLDNPSEEYWIQINSSTSPVQGTALNQKPTVQKQARPLHYMC